LALLGVLCLAQGDWALASTYLEDSLSMVEASGDLQGIRDAQSWLAERDLLEGRPDAARARLVPLLDRPGLREFGVTRLIPLLAWAYLDLGDEARAQEVVEQAIARSRTQNDCLTLTDALRIQAMVATRQERWEEAEIALEEGMALASRMPYPYAQARLLYTAARLHARQGAPGLARTRFEAALGIFRRLGASKDAERVEQAIATLPVGWPVG
jgi:tetratricopeptide (TPR) repeat protein